METSPAEHRDSCINDLKKTGGLVLLLDQSRFCAEIHHMSLVKQEVLQAMVSELETHPAFASHVSKFELQCVCVSVCVSFSLRCFNQPMMERWPTQDVPFVL